MVDRSRDAPFFPFLFKQMSSSTYRVWLALCVCVCVCVVRRLYLLDYIRLWPLLYDEPPVYSSTCSSMSLQHLHTDKTEKEKKKERKKR